MRAAHARGSRCTARNPPSRNTFSPIEGLQSVSEQRSKIFHQQEELVGFGRAGLEVEALIPGSRLVVLGVHEQRTDAGASER